MSKSSISAVEPTEGNVDYAALALQDPEFASVVGSTGWINFKDPKVVQALCKALLRKEHGLEVQLADDRLTPYVPVRFNYILWMQRLLDSTSNNYSEAFDANREVTGIDIGIGASAIYALLACKARPNWRMIGTDTDLTSLTYAARNISLNDLESRIRLLETASQDLLIPLDKTGLAKVDFVVCNPPFYSSVKEMQHAFAGSGKARPPSTICTGSETEMVTVGGDLGFVSRMVEESVVLNERIQWYSAMMGKLESLYAIVEKLKGMNCSNWATHYLTGDGGRTRRWAVAWSWSDFRPTDDVARGKFLKKEILPFPSEYNIPRTHSVQSVAGMIQQQMNTLDLRWRWDDEQMAGLVLIAGDVWSRRARRMREKQSERYKEIVQGPLRLVVKISVREEDVVVRWVRGSDVVLFEQFCEMMKRKLDEMKGT